MTAAPPVSAAAQGVRPAADLGDPVIRIQDATMRFGDVVAISHISLDVWPQTILGVIGPSGAGKTTTIRLLTGALRPTRGEVEVLRERPDRFHRRTRERIGYMPQLFTLYPDLTAGENIDFVASLFGMLWRRRRRRVREVLQVVDLWDARGRRAADLSGGMQRRLELACALVHEPELLFLDEPTAGIDPLLRTRIWEELHRLKDTGRTLIVTTQYVNEAEECDMVALIAEGRLAALAAPDELRRQATGGDVIELETAGPFDIAVLEALPDVRSVRQVGARDFQVVVDDAGVATPNVVAAVGQAGGEVVAAREYRPSFDDVFTELVARSRANAEPAEVDRADANGRNVRREVDDPAPAARRKTALEDRAAVRAGEIADEDDRAAVRASEALAADEDDRAAVRASEALAADEDAPPPPADTQAGR